MEQSTTFYHFQPHFSKKSLNIVYKSSINGGIKGGNSGFYGKDFNFIKT